LRQVENLIQMFDKVDCPSCQKQFKGITLDKYGGKCRLCSRKICTPKTKICIDEHCRICCGKRLSSYPEAKLWSKENTVATSQVHIGSNKKYLFQCAFCKHETLKEVRKARLINCPYCKGKKKCTEQNCSTCNSGLELLENVSWSKKKQIKLWQVTRKTYKYYLNCQVCSHEWLGKITSSCPYCAKRKICDDIKCKSCFNRRWVLPDNLIWSVKNEKQSWQVCKNSRKLYWFCCKDCDYEWQSPVRKTCPRKKFHV